MNISIEHYTDPLLLGKYAGICYGREGNDENRLKHIIEVGHLSVLRFGMAVIKIEGISRVCLAQLTRSKHLEYLVRSSRYCDESDTGYTIPQKVREAGYTGDYIDAYEKSRELYRAMRAAGVSKQDARFILPQAQHTELYVSGNYQAWRDFIKLRTSKSAQWEVREVAQEVARLLREVAPIIFEEV